MTPNQLRQALLSISPENHSEQVSSGSVFTLAIDYSLTKLQMIQAGHYDYVDNFLQGNDPFKEKNKGSGSVEVTVELVHLDRDILTENAIKELKKSGLELGGIEHLLALGAKHTDLQREFPIVALSSVWQNPNGNRGVPYLWSYSGGVRGLSLYWGDFVWGGRYRFLAVRNSLHSPPKRIGGVSFLNSFFHPPSILPISSRNGEIAVYFLLSIILSCQAIFKKKFILSNFVFAF